MRRSSPLTFLATVLPPDNPLHRSILMSVTTNVVLEPAAREFAEATSAPPYLFDLGPVKGRRL